MEWRIQDCSYGGVFAEYGAAHQGGYTFPGMPGVTLPAFIVYESVWFETRRKAEAFIRRRSHKRNWQMARE